MWLKQVIIVYPHLIKAVELNEEDFMIVWGLEV